MSSWNASAEEEGPATVSNPDVWTVQRVLTWSAGWLKEKGVERSSPRLDVELLLALVLECDRMKLYLQLDRPLGREERDRFKVLLRRRVDGEPIAYILGYRDFYRHRFVVTPAVLIPRADTETLVEKALESVLANSEPQILDVGTGSGCIAVSLALEKIDGVVMGWDVSKDALEVAAKNAEQLSCKNVEWALQDVRTAGGMDGRFDLIVSNPPYITRAEEQTLSVSVRSFEPHLALFDGDEDGLGFYRVLAEKAPLWLKPGGSLMVECGHTQAPAIAAIFLQAGLQELTITKDLAGKERVVAAKR